MRIFNKEAVKNWLFFDIEVVREFENFNVFASQKNADLWKKANNKYYIDHIAEFGDKDVDEVCYEKNAAFFPEYGKVISVAIGFYTSSFEKIVKSAYDDDEKTILRRVALLFNNYNEKCSNNGILCGFNVMEFDIPYIIKRMIKHEIKVPRILVDCVSAKPWDTNVVDVMRYWKFNGMKNTSLGTLEEFLGVESSKEGEINGMNLGEKYWNCKTKEERLEILKKIGNYAEKDVSYLMDIVIKLCDSY